MEGGYSGVVEQLRRLRGDGWLGKGVATMERGCPTTVGVVVEQLRRAPGLKLGGLLPHGDLHRQPTAP